MIRNGFGKTMARRLLIGSLALVIPATAGCEAGLNAPTLEFHPASTGAHVIVNDIAVTNLFVLGAPSGSTLQTGSSASVFLSLYNGGSSTDALVKVSAPTASTVQLSGGTVSLPVNAAVNLTGPQPTVVLSGLKKPLVAGQDIALTLNFQNAGQVTLQVPVQPQSYEFSTYSPPATP